MDSQRPKDRAPEDYEALAEALEQDCRRLLSLLTCLERVAPDEIENVYRRQMKDARRVRVRISAAAARLERGRSEIEYLAPRIRDYVRARVRQSRELICDAGRKYAGIIDRVAALMASVRGQLAELERGGKAVRGYARAVR